METSYQVSQGRCNQEANGAFRMQHGISCHFDLQWPVPQANGGCWPLEHMGGRASPSPWGPSMPLYMKPAIAGPPRHLASLLSHRDSLTRPRKAKNRIITVAVAWYFLLAMAMCHTGISQVACAKAALKPKPWNSVGVWRD